VEDEVVEDEVGGEDEVVVDEGKSYLKKFKQGPSA